MRAALETLEAVAQDHGSPEFWELHRDFHWALLEPGASAWIRRVLEQIWLASQRYVRLFVSETVDDAMADHRELLVCCEHRDGEPRRERPAPAPRPHRARGAPGVHARRRGRRRLAPCAPSIVSEYGAPPEPGERAEPQARDGQAVVELLAAALNPADLAIASGRFPAGSPPLPYVPGIEGVGTGRRSPPASRRGRASGPRAAASASRATARSRERFVAADEVLVEVPEAASTISSPPRSARSASPRGCRSSWLAPVRAGEVVLVLGATGSVGSVAVQVAKLLGAGRVVAVGRDAARLEAVARARRRRRPSRSTATTSASGWPRRSTARRRRSCSTCSAGPPLEAALGRRRPGSADRPPGAVGGADRHARRRASCAGSSSQLLGYSNFAVPLDALAQGYADVRRARGRRPASASTPRRCRSIASGRPGRARRSGRDVKLVLVP